MVLGYFFYILLGSRYCRLLPRSRNFYEGAGTSKRCTSSKGKETLEAQGRFNSDLGSLGKLQEPPKLAPAQRIPEL